MRKWLSSPRGFVIALTVLFVFILSLFLCGLPVWRYVRDYGKPVSWTPLVTPLSSAEFATLTPTLEMGVTQVFPTPAPSAVFYPTYTPVVYVPLSPVPATAIAPTDTIPKPVWRLPIKQENIYKLCKIGIDHRRENPNSDLAWDFCAAVGVSVYPIADGMVIYASEINSFGLGGVVQIYHPCGWISTYGNLGRVFVRAGDFVSTETVLGTIGFVGENRPLKYGPVLHLAVETLGGYKIPQDIGKPKTGQQDMLNADVELALLASGLVYCAYPPCFVPGYEPTIVPPTVVLPTETLPPPSATTVVPLATAAPTQIPSPAPSPTSTEEPSATPFLTDTVVPEPTWTAIPSPTDVPELTATVEMESSPTAVEVPTVEETATPEPRPTSVA